MQNLTDDIDGWYRDNGYVFARVASRKPVRKGVLLFEAHEPRVADEPVEMRFYAAAPAGAPAADAADAPVLATSPPELQPLPAAPSAADRDRRDEGSI